MLKYFFFWKFKLKWRKFDIETKVEKDWVCFKLSLSLKLKAETQRQTSSTSKRKSYPRCRCSHVNEKTRVVENTDRK